MINESTRKSLKLLENNMINYKKKKTKILESDLSLNNNSGTLAIIFGMFFNLSEHQARNKKSWILATSIAVRIIGKAPGTNLTTE